VQKFDEYCNERKMETSEELMVYLYCLSLDKMSDDAQLNEDFKELRPNCAFEMQF